MKKRRSAGEVVQKLYLLKTYLLVTYACKTVWLSSADALWISARSHILVIGARPFAILTKEVTQGRRFTETLPGRQL